MAASTARLAALLLLAGCKSCKDGDADPSDLTEVSLAVTGVYVGEGVGVGSATVPLYGTNALGAVVPASDLVSDGGTVAQDVAGWGVLTLEASATVSATAGGDAATGAAWVVAAEAPTFELAGFALHSAEEPADHLAIAGEGAVWVSGTTVWWGSQTQPALVVAELPDSAANLQTVQLEGDGVTDLMIWTAGSVILLRGRDGGGLTFAAGWTSTTEVVGCDVQDLDGDGLVDVQIATSDGSTSTVVWMISDGTSWAMTDWMVLDYGVIALAGEDYTSDGEVEISVLSEDGILQRYARYDEGWQLGSGSGMEVAIGPGARMYPSTDLNGDGIDEILVAGPLVDGTGWQVKAITAGAASTYIFSFYSADVGLPTSVAVAMGDLSGDGITDLGMTSELGLLRLAWNEGYVSSEGVPTPAFQSTGTDDYPSDRGVGVGQLLGDDVQDVLLAGETYVLAVEGARQEDDPETESSELGWKAKASAVASYSLHIEGEPLVGDFDGDGGADFISFVLGDDGLSLQTWQSYPDNGDIEAGWTEATSLLISPDSAPVALTMCEGEPWALFIEGGVSVLASYAMSAGVPAGAAVTTEAIGDHVLCGPFADGSLVAVVDHASSTLSWVAPDGTVTSETLPAITVGAADTDGDGVRELVTQDSEGEIAAWDFDGDGIEEVVQRTAGEIAIAEARPAFGGRLSIADADGDGLAEVILQDDGTVWVYRVVNGALVPPSVFHTTRLVTGPAWFGDMSGDGLPDLLLTGRDDDPNDTAEWAGTWLNVRR